MKSKMKRIILIALLGISSFLSAQKKDKNLYEGTQEFGSKNYINSEANFRVSQSKNEEKRAVANYNLGTSIYRQNQPGEAKFKFFNAIESAKTKEEKHKAYHNLGNTFMLEENYQAAVDAYKNALRNNPYDEETRYNYALAKQKLKENPPKGNQDNKDKDKDKDQNQNQNQDNQDDKKDKKDNGNDKDKKDSDQGDKDDNKNKGDKKEDKNEDNKDDKQSQNPKPSGANKQQIESILDAVNNAEKNIQDKINAKKVKAQPKTNDKDW
jgi:hypothetical protein